MSSIENYCSFFGYSASGYDSNNNFVSLAYFYNIYKISNNSLIQSATSGNFIVYYINYKWE